MTNTLKQLIKLLSSQVIDPDNWPVLEPTIKQVHDGTIVYIESLEIGLRFSKDGELIGGFNYKQ